MKIFVCTSYFVSSFEQFDVAWSNTYNIGLIICTNTFMKAIKQLFFAKLLLFAFMWCAPYPSKNIK